MFAPKRILFEKGVLDYEMARKVLDVFKDRPGVEIIHLTSNRYKEYIPGEDLYHQYREGKRTLMVGTKKSLKFQTCKPSAHYQLPLVSGCMGQCEYCYLNTQLGDRPFVKIHVNIEEILQQAQKHIDARSPEVTIFEGAATSDLIPVEPYTGALERAIEFFGRSPKARFRFVTKYDDIHTLLDIEHNGHTEMRFSLNTSFVIDSYEHSTASRDRRIDAGIAAAKAGYPMGFLIAPVFLYPHWRKDYHELFLQIRDRIPGNLQHPITFEVISHRYTTKAKNRILHIFPQTDLPMEDEDRQFKYGQFGYGKYVYQKEQINEIKEFFTKEMEALFDNKKVLYII